MNPAIRAIVNEHLLIIQEELLLEASVGPRLARMLRTNSEQEKAEICKALDVVSDLLHESNCRVEEKERLEAEAEEKATMEVLSRTGGILKYEE